MYIYNQSKYIFVLGLILLLVQCLPVQAASLDADLSQCDSPTCTWQFGDGNSTKGCKSQDYTYSESGTYDVTFTMDCGQLEQQVTREVSVGGTNTLASCQHHLDAGHTESGVYEIDPDGEGGVEPFNVYCDQDSAGGGWTMVVAQYEQDPVTNWNEGVQSDYDPTLEAKNGFALNSQELPEHDQVAFGKDKTATAVDYVNWTYSTGDISKTRLSGKKGDVDYHVHRKINDYYSYHDPETTLTNSEKDVWHDTLTFDVVDSQYSWAFCPNHSTYHRRGYAYSQSKVTYEHKSFAWTVWVR